MLDKKIIIGIFNSKRIWFVLIALLFYMFCSYEYKVFVFDLYGYMGFEYEFILSKSVFSFSLFCLSFIFLGLDNSDFIKGFSALFQILFILPILVLYQFMEMDISFILFSLLLLFIINFQEFKLKLPVPPLLLSRQRSILLLIISILSVIPFFLVFKINYDPTLFLMGSELYDVRSNLAGIGNKYTSYMLSPISQVLLPACVIYGLKEKNVPLVAFAVLTTITLFLMIPQKSIFFGIFVMIFFYFFNSSFKKVLVFLSLTFGLLIIGKVLYILNGHLMTESLLLRRYLLLPSYLNIIYFDFFKDQPLYFSHSIFSSIYEYPFDIGPTFLIGKAAFDNVNTNANNGFLSDGFMNMGYIGMFLFTVIIGFIIKLFDSMNISPKYFGLFFLLINLLRSSALLTSLLTHGIWLLILISYFFLFQKTNLFSEKQS